MFLERKVTKAINHDQFVFHCFFFYGAQSVVVKKKRITLEVKEKRRSDPRSDSSQDWQPVGLQGKRSQHFWGDGGGGGLWGGRWEKGGKQGFMGL